MDRTLTKLRLESVLTHIDLIRDDLKDLTIDGFSKSDLHVRATCFSLMQIGEQLTKLESLFAKDYPEIP